MNASGLLQTWVDAGSEVDNLWQMYIVVHLGLFWFFFLVHRPLLIVERMIAIFAYGCFVYINGNALIHSYNLLEAMRVDLIGKMGRDFAQAPATLRMLEAVNYAERDKMILITHLGGFALVVILLLVRNVMIRRYFAAYPEQQGRQHGLTD